MVNNHLESFEEAEQISQRAKSLFRLAQIKLLNKLYNASPLCIDADVYKKESGN
jgi:hypothetical protein